ncbi:solute carrier family 22 member 5-like [Brienomyrus brachyistius]|uniref:solute carrier family 22 member 5-like n=1 Tax=Brienomyrus brachyistius TaxID=42636 RepID=UPI0020B2B2CE|nr:solute carrier family 22 member 5-like [Brienomyrus brachyistius]
MENYEEITSFLGEWGRFQKCVFFLLSLTFIPHGYLNLSMVFLAATPQHHCEVSYTYGENISDYIPYEGTSGDRVLSRCRRYKHLNGTAASWANETEGCLDGWRFSADTYKSTIVTEWSLVCEDSWKAPFASSVLFFGVMAGSLISGQVSDRFGRKLVFFGSLVLMNTFAVLQALSSSWEWYCTFYFFVGMARTSSYISGFILGSELLGKSTRVLFSSLGVCICYALGYTCLPIFAYFIRDWRMLLMALTIPGFLCIPLWWIIPESPRWLLSHGHVDKADAIIRAIARKNGVDAPEIIFKTEDGSQLLGKTAPQRVYTIIDLIRTTNIRNITILNTIIWIVTSMTYYGLSLNTPNMGGDPYLNCFISAVSEIVAYVATWLFMRYTVRRFTLIFLFLLSGVTLLIIKFVPDELDAVVLVLVMVGKGGITAAYCFIYIYSTEMFPTVLRNTGMGAISTATRVGTILSPYIAYIGDYNKVAPYILMGSVTVSVAFLSLLLPETKDSELPELISQVKPIMWCDSESRPSCFHKQTLLSKCASKKSERACTDSLSRESEVSPS